MIPPGWLPTVARDNLLAIPLFKGLKLGCGAVFRGLPAEQGVARAARVTRVQSPISRHSTPLLLRMKEVCERPKTSSFLIVPLPVPSRNIGLSCVGTKSVFSRHSTHPSKKREKFWRAQKPVSAAEIGRGKAPSCEVHCYSAENESRPSASIPHSRGHLEVSHPW